MNYRLKFTIDPITPAFGNPNGPDEAIEEIELN